MGVTMKFKWFSILLIVLVVLSACSSVDPKEYMDEVYIAALDALMEEDPGLNNDMAFIAIDMSNFNYIDEDEQTEILNFFKETYQVDVMDATFEQLKEMGLYNEEDHSLYGVLLKIEEVEFKFNNKVFFKASKFRSGKGAIGVEGKVYYKNDEWKKKDVEIKWIS